MQCQTAPYSVSRPCVETKPDDAMDIALDSLGDQLTAYRVGRDVGKVANNHAGLVERLSEDA